MSFAEVLRAAGLVVWACPRCDQTTIDGRGSTWVICGGGWQDDGRTPLHPFADCRRVPDTELDAREDTMLLAGSVGRLDGWPVIESAGVKTPTVYIFADARRIICRYKEDVEYRIKLDEIKKAMRADLWRQLHEFAARHGITDW